MVSFRLHIDWSATLNPNFKPEPLTTTLAQDGADLEVAEHNGAQVGIGQAAEGPRVEPGARGGGRAGGVPQRPRSRLCQDTPFDLVVD